MHQAPNGINPAALVNLRSQDDPDGQQKDQQKS